MMNNPDTRRELEGRLALLQRKIRATVVGMEEEPLSLNIFLSFEKDIEGWLEELEGVSWSMEELLAAKEEAESLAELFQASFRFKREVRRRLGVVRTVSEGNTSEVPSEDKRSPNVKPTFNPHSQESTSIPEPTKPFNPTAHSSFSVEPFKIKLKGPHFSEKDFERNRKSFKDFLTKFENCAMSIPSAEGKLYFLRCSLEGRALQLIDHLSVSEDSYPMAMKLLKEQYLDEEEVRGEIIQSILDFRLENPKDLVELKDFMVKTQADVWELRASYNCDLYDDMSAGAIIISQVLFAKLSSNIKSELIRIAGKTYPTLSVILLKTPEIIKRVLIVRKPEQHPVAKLRPPPRPRKETEDGPHSSLKAFNAKVEANPQKCEFCKKHDHSSESCPYYTSNEARITRCKELWLCFRCLKKSHRGAMCPLRTARNSSCSSCTVKGHVTAMCPDKRGKVRMNSCLHMNDYSYGFMSPVVSLVVRKGNSQLEVNCLLDTGSQRTYLDTSVLERLSCLSTAKKSKLEVKTFLGTETRRFKEASVELGLIPGKVHTLQVLSSELSLSHELPELPQIIRNLRHHQLATKYNSWDSYIKVEGLLGIDAIQFIEPFQVVPCMYGAAFLTPRGLVPFGNSRCFMYESQLKPRHKTTKGAKINYTSLLAKTPSLPESRINFVLKPEENYSDPLKAWFEEGNVQRGLERMFNMESLGLPMTEEFSTVDEEKVQKFRNTISYRDGRYHVQLPWYEDKVKSVPSNHNAALRILERVVKDLEKKDLYDQYLDVFRQQEKEGIIEEIAVAPENFRNYVWIPHRPVLKLADQTTTKVRPVFNCSYKTTNSISLNETAYPGVNLMGDMLELLIHFRTNKYVLLADIRKAFLMIRLDLEKDRNRFCFFLKKGDNLHCYRYSTILFGFNASPFILNYVLKYHAEKFPSDECSQVLRTNFYVDNLVKTGNDVNTLSTLYTTVKERLQEGHFEVQSCNSNSAVLRKKMAADGTLSGFDTGVEKVLGYLYSPQHDTMKVCSYQCVETASTKRKMLSEASKLFDPLSLYLPVTIRSRMLIGELWKQKLDWDDEVPEESKRTWKALAKDLTELGSVAFPRRVLEEKKPIKLFLFCDASKMAYGFSAYAVQDGQSALVFAKAKVAPLKGKSLPTLELLSVFLALKCFPFIKEALKNTLIEKVYFLTDAQVVLAWILAKTINTKNIFARNRLQEITQMAATIRSEMRLDLSFQYVPTKENPADYIIRGLTFKKFRENLSYWYEGPAWIRQEEIQWNRMELGCLSQEQKDCIRPAINLFMRNENESPPIISVGRFSNFNRLINVMTLVFKFVNKTLKKSEDNCLLAKIYLIKLMQWEAFAEELDFLLDPEGKSQPKLVKNLNLFLDPSNIIRSKGRIGGSEWHSYEVQNPILLGKKHHLTSLIIKNNHQRNQHLGLATTLNEIRLSGYWIPQARQAVKKIVSSCAKCKKYNATAFSTPNATDLPSSRVNLVRPYLHTGVDYTSHIWVRGEVKEYKMYIIIFTCMAIRAVHIELVPDMKVSSFIQAFVRFTNANGVPSHLYSDNARTFVSAAKIIGKGLITDEFREKFGSYHLKHCTIPLYSAWYGGTWERTIKTVKSCLYKTIGRGKVDYFGLLTTLSDIQCAINSRPLTYRSSDEMDCLTPNSLMNPNVGQGLIIRLDHEDLGLTEPHSRIDLKRTLHLREENLEKFRRMWHEDYLLSLRERNLELSNLSFNNAIKRGDIVLIKDPLKTRPFWSIGEVLELIEGKDGLVRSARVRKGNGSILTHSINHLFPLEINSLANNVEEEILHEPEDVPDQNLSSRHDESVRIWICPACDKPEDYRPMVACDQCDDWFHFGCVGLVDAPSEEKWYCPTCRPRCRSRPSLLGV